MTTPTTEKLKECPFCGGDKIVWAKQDQSCCSVMVRLACDTCGASGEWGSTPEKAVKSWNTRSLQPSPEPSKVTVARFAEDLTHEGYVHLSKTGDADQETLVNTHLAKAISKKYPHGLIISGETKGEKE